MLMRSNPIGVWTKCCLSIAGVCCERFLGRVDAHVQQSRACYYVVGLLLYKITKRLLQNVKANRGSVTELGPLVSYHATKLFNVH